MRKDRDERRPDSSPIDTGYEAPRIELVLLAEDLEREVLFAGVAVSRFINK